MPFFQVRDLMINVVDERLRLKRRGSMLCFEDQPTQINCGHASPVMQAVKLSPRFEGALAMAGRLLESGDPEGVPALNEVAGEIGKELVAGAVVGAGVGMPDPNCGGTSYETIPTPITPVVHGASVLDAADLPAIKLRIREALTVIEKLEAQLAPRGGIQTEVAFDHLQRAAAALRSK